MASATRTFTRALRTPSLRTPVSTRTRFLAPAQAFRQQQSRRGYASSQGPDEKFEGNPSGLIIGATALVLGAVGYASYVSKPEWFGAEKKVKGPFKATYQDYQAVYDAVAKHLQEKDDYDDGSYGPVLLRLAWHASGT